MIGQQPAHSSPTATGSPARSDFFRVERNEGRWSFLTPANERFISLGVNHIEETDLHHHYNGDVWVEKYGSRSNWIRAVREDLEEYGFNTIGWTQQWIAGNYVIDADRRNHIDLRHSAGWTSDELRSAGMPFVQNLRFMEIEYWNGNPLFPDVFSDDFRDYCKHVARRIAGAHRDDANLLGYFYVDIPAWLPHETGRNFPQLESGMSEQAYTTRLSDVAAKYYEVATDAVRAVDPDHLILGDRYNGNIPIPEVVLEAAAPYIDVLSVQYFPGPTVGGIDKMRDDLRRWSKLVDKPVLVADIGNNAPSPLRSTRPDALDTQKARGDQYRVALESLLREDWLVGFHWCGFIENHTRGWGIKTHHDEPHEDFIRPAIQANRHAQDLVHSRQHEVQV